MSTSTKINVNFRSYVTPQDAANEIQCFTILQIGNFRSANIIRGYKTGSMNFVCLDDLKNLASIRHQIINDMPLILREKQK